MGRKISSTQVRKNVALIALGIYKPSLRNDMFDAASQMTMRRGVSPLRDTSGFPSSRGAGRFSTGRRTSRTIRASPSGMSPRRRASGSAPAARAS